MSFSDSLIQASLSQDDLDSLPSSEISDESSNGENSDAQEEWEASLQQLEMILTMVIVPYAGKFLGRKFAVWSWARYMNWMYPTEVTYRNKAVSRPVAAVHAATL